MKRLLLAAACLLPLGAVAQTPFTGPDGYTAAIANGAAKCDVLASNCMVTPNGALIQESLQNLLAEYGLQPDRFKQAGDGADDAPAIQRAINLVCSGAGRTNRLEFRPRHYAIHSQIAQSCLANWHGRGFLEQAGVASNGPGTWLDIGAEFIGASLGHGPILINGGTGSVIEDLGIDEPAMTPPPVPVCDPSYPCGAPTQRITGYAPSTWIPAAFWYAFEVQGAPGTLFRHIMLNGVNAGFLVMGSGRTNFQDIRGQVFGATFNIQESYDVSQITDVHIWPYWSSADPVMLYQQANANVIVSGRNDSPFWDNIFGFGVQSTIDIVANADGTTTGAQVGKVQCDSNVKCVRIEAQTVGQVTMSIGEVRTFDNIWSTIYGHPPIAHNPGSTLLQLDGSAILQIGQMENFGTDISTVTFGSATSPSNIQVGSMFVHRNQMSPNSFLVKFPSAHGTIGSLLTLGMPPLLAGTIVGFQLTNTAPSTGGGIGTFQYSVPTVFH